MRRVIRQAHGGAYMTIPAAAWPYFQPEGWVVIEDIDDDTSIPPLYLSRVESDARYALKEWTTPSIVHGDDPNVERPDITGPVIWFGTVDPVNADDSQDFTVYGTADDGSTPEVGGGTSFTGDAADVDYDPSSSGLSATDVQSALDEVVSDMAAALAGKATLAEVQDLLDEALANTAIEYAYYRALRYAGTGAMPRPPTTRPVSWRVPAAFSLPNTGTTVGGTTAYVDDLDEVLRY